MKLLLFIAELAIKPSINSKLIPPHLQQSQSADASSPMNPTPNATGGESPAQATGGNA